MTAAADKARAGRAARAKGQRGERQVAALIADLTGWTIKRRVRNHAGDGDLEGVPNWSVEVKDRARPTLGDRRAWWEQAVGQAIQAAAIPVLIFKMQPGEWRAVWPGEIYGPDEWCTGHAYAHEGSLEAWAKVAREWAPATQASPAAGKRAVEPADAPEVA